VRQVLNRYVSREKCNRGSISYARFHCSNAGSRNAANRIDGIGGPLPVILHVRSVPLAWVTVDFRKYSLPF